ncbi:hypothetical protein ACHWQZ_G008338 [Mnemiopsis leidyi]
MAVRISTQSLVTNILIFGCLQLSIESKSVTSCKKCLRVIDQNRPEIKEFKLNFNVTSDGVGVPVESPCRIENCGDLFADSCLQVVLEMSSTTSVHIHSCGNSSMSDERVCQLLQYGAGADVSCSVSRSISQVTSSIFQVTSSNQLYLSSNQLYLPSY